MTEGLRIALVIFLVAGATVGAAWGYTAYNGPLADDAEHTEQEDDVFLITYRLFDREYTTEVQEFEQGGEIVFAPIPVTLQNVTKVDVILQVATTGPSVNDAYEVQVQDPQGDARTGSHAVAFPQPEGYIRSDTVIDWARTPQPGAESHRAEDRDDAARWSAEKRTDTSATGEWQGAVTLNPPPVASSGNASLLLRFTWYEAVVLPSTPAPLPSPAQNTTGNATGNGTGPVLFDAPPRTFITSRSVDGDR